MSNTILHLTTAIAQLDLRPRPRPVLRAALAGVSTRITSPLVHAAALVVLAVLTPVRATAAGADVKSDLAAIWNDPTFQKQFVGAYGINAEVEPRLTVEEVKVLDKVRPFMTDDLAKAEALLVKSIKPDGSAVLDFTLGGVLFQLERTDEARQQYEKAVTKFPSFRRAWRNLGLIHAKAGTFDDAIRAFTKMIELGGGDAYSYGLLGYAYASKLDYQAAEAAYRNALLLQPENTEWRLGLTRCVYKQHKFQDAAALLDVLIERFPDKTEFWMLQAQTFLGMKQPLRAAENIEALGLLGRADAENLNVLGDIYTGEALYELAASAYLRAIDASSTLPPARALRAAEMLAARGANAEARRVAARIHVAWKGELAETESRKLLKLEARLRIAAGDGGSDTASILEELVRVDPLDGEALLLLGQHHAKNGEPDRAIFYYERAESLEAFEVNARVRHAQALVTLGRYADAIPLLRRAQELKPREDVARYLEQVERLAKARR
ncbi:MAG: tetratricopeptide repeat protein [Planctomycetes bacterium]|nr:tetratricopeptide repeat protein [Planctomycetota bacterium]